jgi:hypothetical protein
MTCYRPGRFSDGRCGYHTSTTTTRFHGTDRQGDPMTSSRSRSRSRRGRRAPTHPPPPPPSDFESCCICYESLDHVQILPCGHEFHPRCIDTWMTDHNTCPLCRSVVRRDRSPPPPPPPAHYYAEDLSAEDDELGLSDDDELDPDVVITSMTSTPPPRPTSRRLLFDVSSDEDVQVVPPRTQEERVAPAVPDDEDFVNPGLLRRDSSAPTRAAVSQDVLQIDAERLQTMLDRTVETMVGRLLAEMGVIE